MAVLLAASWLRAPGELYLVATLAATAVAGAAVWRGGGTWARGAAGAFALAALAFLIPGATAHWRLRAGGASGASEEVNAPAAALARAVADGAARTDALARDALQAATARGGAPFAALRALVAPAGPAGAERGVALLRGDSLVAWAGVWRVSPDVAAPAPPAAGATLVRTPFYLALVSDARDGPWRAVATTLVHADAPADTLAAALDRRVAAAFGVRDFVYVLDDGTTGTPAAMPAAGGAAAGAPAWASLGAVAGGRRMLVRPLVPGAAEARERALDQGRREAAPALLLMTLVWVAAVWRRGRDRGPRAARGLLVRRLVALLVPAGVLALAPLNALSNASRAFDPSVYYSGVGGRFTASVGALALAGLVLVAGLLALLRAGARVPSRLLAVGAIGALAWGAPYLLRELSRGITPPAGGAPVWLWVAWQVALFLVAAALLVAAAVAGRRLLDADRGLPPLTAPAIAAAAALAGPALWSAPAGWPRWYALMWAAAVASLALTRRTAALLLAAGTVAGLGSATMVWSATARRRVEAAERDVRGLVAPDPEALRLLERLADALADSARAGRLAAVDPGGTALLRAYAASPLASAGYPVALALWDRAPGDGPPQAVGPPPRLAARVATTQWRVDSAALGVVLAEARRVVGPTVRPVAAEVGAASVLASALPDGRTLSLTLFPRTRLRPGDPVAALLGQGTADGGEAPYTLALDDARRPGAAAPAGLDPLAPVPPGRWTRSGDELHGDWVLPLPGGPARAHAEVQLRPVDMLAARGVLLTLVDLAVGAALWASLALADGALGPARRRWRLARLGSFRARLTLALLAFSGAPTVAFAVWSYRQLRADDRESRALLVREALREALAEGAAATPAALAAAGARVGTPLLAYRGGILRGASEPAVAEVAPFGRTLPAAVAADLAEGGEVAAVTELRLAGAEALVGFRAADGGGPAGGGAPLVLAAPARVGDLALDGRRRDLGFLVLLAAAGGSLASLWLSGLAARQLSRPVGALRRAALAIGGARPADALGPTLDAALGDAPAARATPSEFRPVFGAFRQMAADLAAGREALEASRRRTDAVLRDVASGVLAVDGDARVTLANPRVEALLGRAMPPGSALEGRAPALLAARVRAFVWRGRAGPDEEAFDVEVGGRQLRARLTRLGAAGDGGAVLTLDDLTELARAERVLAWGEMARQVAHEIKNPLTPIRLGVQLLRRAHRDGRADFGERLEVTVERVLAEIDRLDEIARAFSKYGTAPDRHAPPDPVDAAAVARDVVELERLGQGAVSWELEGADAPAPALARDGELREVLLNLLENARLAGATRVALRVFRADGHVALAVADDGEGIPAEVLPRIFEPRFSTRTSGSGLGLAISRRLAEAWGGAVHAESRRAGDPPSAAGLPGAPSGTTVTLRLRVAPDAPGADASAPGASTRAAAAPGPAGPDGAPSDAAPAGPADAPAQVLPGAAGGR